MSVLALASLLCLSAPALPPGPPGSRGASGVDDELRLPEGRVAELFDTVRRAGAGSVVPPAAWPAWSDGSESAWGGAHVWREWVELLRDEAAGRGTLEEHATRRARLALLAVAQERTADAWGHLLAAGASPLVEAVRPALLPGVPLERLGSSEPLPEGVLLTPGLPPARDGGPHDRLAGLAGREMACRGIRVAESTLELKLVVEGDGVQIDLIHHGGPPVRVRVLAPAPPGVEVGRIYANWEEAGEGRMPVEVFVEPEPRRKTVWARFRPRHDRWPQPMPTPGGAAPATAQGELLVVVPPDRVATARLRCFTDALSELFGRPARLTTRAGAASSTSLLEPTAIHLERGDATDRKLLGVIGMLETHALAGAARR